MVVTQYKGTLTRWPGYTPALNYFQETMYCTEDEDEQERCLAIIVDLKANKHKKLIIAVDRTEEEVSRLEFNLETLPDVIKNKILYNVNIDLEDVERAY